MKHMDEARREAIEALKGLLAALPADVRIVLLDDLSGTVRAVLFANESDAEVARTRIAEKLAAAAGPWWSGDVWVAHEKTSGSDRLVYERAWEDGRDVVKGRLRSHDRHRNRTAWFGPTQSPPWASAPSNRQGPPTIVFYSFKGGVGRSTALASFASRRAREGDRVVVIDADLGAPGIGRLLASDEQGTASPWGLVDYLIERRRSEVDLSDYFHACRREAVSGSGEILVMPAGRVDSEYLGKLARVDLEPAPPAEHPFRTLLREASTQLKPQWVLLDARAGLADIGGMLLSGLAHMHLLFGTNSEQSWAGLRMVIERLGADRVRLGEPQADCLVAQAMVPRTKEVAALVEKKFAERAHDEFVEHYYAKDPDSDETDDSFWYVRDAEDSDAPHVPVALHYDERFATFDDLASVADDLSAATDYTLLGGRIEARFEETSE